MLAQPNFELKKAPSIKNRRPQTVEEPETKRKTKTLSPAERGAFLKNLRSDRVFAQSLDGHVVSAVRDALFYRLSDVLDPDQPLIEQIDKAARRESVNPETYPEILKHFEFLCGRARVLEDRTAAAQLSDHDKKQLGQFYEFRFNFLESTPPAHLVQFALKRGLTELWGINASTTFNQLVKHTSNLRTGTLLNADW